MFGFSFKEPSTLRGLAWLIFAVVGSVAYWQGKDLQPLLILAATVVGGIGAITRDQTKSVSELTRDDVVVTKDD
jgi:Ni/Fe-hydrogenase subunit HybB-like protein